jgi:hypothetical protein
LGTATAVLVPIACGGVDLHRPGPRTT